MEVGISLDAYLKGATPTDGVARLARIGFDAIDLNLSDWCYSGSPFAGDDWKEWIQDIGETAGSNDIRIGQCHSPIYDRLEKTEKDAFLDDLMMRTLEACSMIDIPWAVVHPRSYSPELRNELGGRTIEMNVERLERWSKHAGEFGVCLAIENLGHRNASDILEMIHLTDADNLHACLDTGHAYLAGGDPALFARELGDELRVLHVHDNDGKSDQHVAPFVGRIDWPEFMKALRTINYPGVLSLEVHCYVQRMPPELIDEAVSMAHRVGRYLADH